ncbi:hypothetical protein BDZ94DRAFT_1254447 [Collybia nuda]|uniref:Uncharacterized protein n=1 Tax=Collybia nuda TaxID=64659 RepID=A0A9P5YAH6_9AGAR|nr:hypothetical protein BDZ94DRAFT_1254447 [Collybia nuda]
MTVDHPHLLWARTTSLAPEAIMIEATEAMPLFRHWALTLGRVSVACLFCCPPSPPLDGLCQMPHVSLPAISPPLYCVLCNVIEAPPTVQCVPSSCIARRSIIHIHPDPPSTNDVSSTRYEQNTEQYLIQR